MVILGAIIFTLALRKGLDGDSAPSEDAPSSTRGTMQKKAG